MPMFPRTLAASAAALFMALAGPAAAATFTWTTGAFVPGTTAPDPLAATDVLNIQSAAAKSFGVSFSTLGTVNWEAGSGGIGFTTGANVSNSGLWDAQGDAALATNGATTSFNNSGTLRKSGGTGTTQIGNGNGFGFTNSGTIDAQTGTILFSGRQIFNTGTQFIGAGSVVVNRASAFNGAFASANLDVAGGVQTGTGAVLNGQAQWTSGTLAGDWAIAPTATLNLQGGGNKVFDGVSFTNRGTVAWQASSAGLSTANGADVINAGLWDAQGNAALVTNGQPARFTNTGTLRKSAGIGTTQIGNSAAFVVINSGTVDAQTGTILFNGSHTFNTGTVFTGAGSVLVTRSSTFNGAFTSSNLNMSAGAHTGNAAVLNGQAQWTGGTLGGTWSVGPTATLSLQGAGGKFFSDASLVNNGTVAWQAGSSGIGFNNGTIVNMGVWDAQGDAALSFSGGTTNRFTNNGLFKKSGGSGTTSLTNSTGLAFVNNGTVDVQVGTIQLPGAFSNAGTLTGSGTLQSAGGITNSGTLAPGSFGVGTLALTGGTLTQAAGAVFAVDLTNLASFDLLTVAGSVALNGTLALNCLGACSFAVGDSFTILDATSSLSGSFSSVTLAGFTSGAFNVVYDLPTASVRLLVTEAVPAVPEPGSWALMAGGLGALSFMARRRKPVAARL